MASARDLIQRAANALFDPQHATWKSDELLDYLNEGIQTAAAYVSTEFQVSIKHTLEEGARQKAPDGAVDGVVVEWAYDEDDQPVAVLPFDLTSMNQDPSWMQEDPGPVRQWASDPMDPYAFWVYPPQGNPPGKVQLSVPLKPVALTQFDQKVPMREMHFGALVDYILYRAYSKNTQYAGQTGLAQLAYSRFVEHFAPAQSEQQQPPQESTNADST